MSVFAPEKVHWEVRPDGSIHAEGFGDMTLDVMAEIELMERAERVDQSVARLNIAQMNKDLGERRLMECGQVIAEIDVDDYDRQAELEPGCWTDKGFIKEFTKLIPESKVTSRPENVTVLHPGMPGKPKTLDLEPET